jgi:hypothetical protein
VTIQQPDRPSDHQQRSSASGRARLTSITRIKRSSEARETEVTYGHSRLTRKQPLTWQNSRSKAGGDAGNRTRVEGFAVSCPEPQSTSSEAVFEYIARRLGRICGADHKEFSLLAWHLCRGCPTQTRVRGLPIGRSWRHVVGVIDELIVVGNEAMDGDGDFTFGRRGGRPVVCGDVADVAVENASWCVGEVVPDRLVASTFVDAPSIW